MIREPQLDKLIDRACGDHGPKRTAAVEALLALGAPAAVAILDDLRIERHVCGGFLAGLLGRMRDPDVVPILIAELDAKKTILALGARWALAAIRDRRAVAPLCARLGQAGGNLTRRSVTACALGDIGDPEARETLTQVIAALLEGDERPEAVHHACARAEEEFELGSLRVLLEAATALAKLGDQRYAYVPVALVGHRFTRPKQPDPYVLRSDAASALKYVVAPGMLGALERAVGDANVEVRREVIRAVFYLGLPESFGLLQRAARDRDGEAKNNAKVYLSRLAGEEGAEDWTPARWAKWWAQAEGRFQKGVCHRLGRPIVIGDVVELLADPFALRDAAAELRITTGEDFGYDRERGHDQPEVAVRGRAWWAERRGRFPPGRLYKHGFEQPIESVY
jgi:hypothetical protein